MIKLIKYIKNIIIISNIKAISIRMSNIRCNMIIKMGAEESRGSSFQEYRSRIKNNTILAKTTEADTTSDTKTFSYVAHKRTSGKDG